MALPEPFGPDSLIWQHFGSRLGYLHGAAYGILQNMYPALGAGVTQHSDVYDDPWDRLIRSLPQILGVVYDGPEAHATAERIRRYHEPIGGLDDQGRRYHALDPDTYYWAHATFVRAIFFGIEIGGTILTPEQKEQLYRESVDWYAMYGLTMRPVPADYAAFFEYWDRTCASVLEPTPAALRLLALFDHFGDVTYPGVPRWIWRLGAPLIAPPLRWLNYGVFPPVVREKLGITWTARDQRRFERVMRTMSVVWSRMPPRIRWISRAYAAMSRERQTVLK
ncbi:oxygenase MpaB family protein [Cryptosporangium arvum]|uniref:oxygenase MpaB family protein n=1 Tax=Cryptosporangium arvum TaxID=80871 RepID=UPI0004B61541|nr:oxygenase MpaB family protein [Cryptosporangium arvum]